MKNLLSWGVRWVWLALLGCTSPPVATPAVAPAPAPEIPIARPTVDVAGTLRAVAKQRLAEVPRPTPTEIPAFGPCTRPDPDAQAKLRTRIEAWLRQQWPAREAEEPPLLTFGCVDRGGAIVDIAVDTADKGKKQANKGHWLTVRVADRIAVVIETDGIPSTWGGEWAISTELHTMALADLDRDGVFDVVSVRSEHEGGAMTTDLTLTTALSSGHRTTSGVFGNTIELPPQTFEGNVVVVVRDPREQEERVIVRCVDRTGLTKTCPEAVRVQQAVDAEREAKRIVEGAADLVFDRDEVAELATLFQLGERERTELLAASTADPHRVLARAVQRFAAEERGVSQLTFERDAARAGELERLSAAALKELGETECAPGIASPALVAKVRAQIAATERQAIARATTESIKAACDKACVWKVPTPAKVASVCAAGGKQYLAAEWTTSAGEVTVNRKALLFATGERVVPIVDGAKLFHGGPWDSGVVLAMRFYRRGDTLIGLALVDEETEAQLVVVANDGAIIDRRRATTRHYSIKPLLADTTTDGTVLWHGNKQLAKLHPGITDLPDHPVAALAKRFEMRAEARQALIYFAYDLSSTDGRAELIEALTLLEAPAALIARVR